MHHVASKMATALPDSHMRSHCTSAFLCPYYQSVGACRVPFIPSVRHVSIGCLFETRVVGQIRGDTDANYTSPNCLSSLLADHCPVSPLVTACSARAQVHACARVRGSPCRGSLFLLFCDPVPGGRLPMHAHGGKWAEQRRGYLKWAMRRSTGEKKKKAKTTTALSLLLLGYSHSMRLNPLFFFFSRVATSL